jgi:hypothetical protein
MTSPAPEPTAKQSDTVEEFAEAFYGLLQSRALSLGVVDIALEVDGWYVDTELMFATGPDMGISVHAGLGEARFCELLGTDGEEWADVTLEGVDVLGSKGADEQTAVALLVLEGVLDVRRPLL